VITTGEVIVLFEKNEGNGGAFGMLIDDVEIGIDEGFVVKLKI
jgi:hypothetical protein